MSDTRSKPTQHEIAVCAYCIWEKEGRPEGRALNHWLQAELQLVVATIWDEGMTEQKEEITAELVRIYVKEQALSEAGPEPKSKKDSQEPEIERARHGQGGVPQAAGGNHNLNCEDPFVLQH